MNRERGLPKENAWCNPITLILSSHKQTYWRERQLLILTSARPGSRGVNGPHEKTIWVIPAVSGPRIYKTLEDFMHVH